MDFRDRAGRVPGALFRNPLRTGTAVVADARDRICADRSRKHLVVANPPSAGIPVVSPFAGSLPAGLTDRSRGRGGSSRVADRQAITLISAGHAARASGEFRKSPMLGQPMARPCFGIGLRRPSAPRPAAEIRAGLAAVCPAARFKRPPGMQRIRASCVGGACSKALPCGPRECRLRHKTAAGTFTVSRKPRAIPNPEIRPRPAGPFVAGRRGGFRGVSKEAAARRFGGGSFQPAGARERVWHLDGPCSVRASAERVRDGSPPVRFRYRRMA